ncbi:MAG: hypothetical protein NVS1B4_12610 [Gemmatimonadaceae bacterium]
MKAYFVSTTRRTMKIASVQTINPPLGDSMSVRASCSAAQAAAGRRGRERAARRAAGRGKGARRGDGERRR